MLGAYTYQGKNNLIFPLAAGHTLAHLIKNPRPPPFEQDERIIIALTELCSAICAVHKQFSDDNILLGIGCHHDLKPSNILVEGNKFLLADFGLSRFREAAENSKTSYKHNQGCYVAPECENLEELGSTSVKSIIGRSSDVWSLGCILLETLVYMTMSIEGVERFEEERKFRVHGVTFHRFHHGPNHREPVVFQYIESLFGFPNFSELLLLELITDILQLIPTNRPDAEAIETRMCFAAIATVARPIRDLYTRFWSESGSIQAFIERERFASWLESCQIFFSSEVPLYLVQKKANFYPDCQSILESMMIMRDTLEEVLQEIDKPLRPIYRPLEDLNDSLLRALPLHLQASARSRLEIQIVGARPQLVSPDDIQYSHDHEQQRLSTLLIMKTMASLVGQNLITRRPDLKIQAKDLHIDRAFDNHHIGHMFKHGSGEKQKVLCEIKKYEDYQMNESIRKELYVRLENVAELLLQAIKCEFRVLPCAGYFHDPLKLHCGLVYRLPTALDSTESQVTTLQNVLQEWDGRPDLENRFSLARSLAASVLEFHQTGWLQKEISSFNIVFVFPRGSSWQDTVDQPFFLGFSNSRPNGRYDFSEYMEVNKRAHMNYQHPDYLKGSSRVRYRSEFDYYSLGLVLLEIGHWKQLGDLVKTIPGAPEEMRDGLLARIPRLGRHMGGIYRDVTKKCLIGGFEGSADAEKSEDFSLKTFLNTVVEPLAQCVV